MLPPRDRAERLDASERDRDDEIGDEAEGPVDCGGRRASPGRAEARRVPLFRIRVARMVHAGSCNARPPAGAEPETPSCPCFIVRSQRGPTALPDRGLVGRDAAARVDLVGAPGRDQVDLAGGTITAAVELTAEHQSGAEAGPDREEDEVVDSARDA